MSIAENKENQGVTSLSILTVLLVLAGCALLLKPLYAPKTESLAEKARMKADGLAYQLLEINSQLRQGRGPASESSESSYSEMQGKTEGTLGTDPWGQPFNFKVVKTAAASPRIVVWSKGPDGLSGNDDDINASVP